MLDIVQGSGIFVKALVAIVEYHRGACKASADACLLAQQPWLRCWHQDGASRWIS